MLVRVGFSADPDDAFMYWGIASGTVDARGFEFEPVIADIQSLNEWSLEGRLEVTAMSLATYPLVHERYALLPHGASMGSGYGPIVVAKEKLTLEQLRDEEIVVPGTLTTAFLVLRMALGGELASRVLPFDRILDEVASDRARVGLLIHEGQLTYADAGLEKCLDLGEWWLLETGLPLPLGVNTIRRDLGGEAMRKISDVLRESIDAALTHREQALEYALGFGRGLDDARGDRFVEMYVNDLTLDYGDEGRQAVRELLERAHAGIQVQWVE
ncbi:MAG: ABC transporter substrate-binding protein [Actinobacteria bacterium]|nr:ABC transporter substrate-binding protein [Actinomycetota bacterium]MBV8480584.1 ABC transporter substrate-binding protein [Actinomycetota bacterium]